MKLVTLSSVLIALIFSCAKDKRENLFQQKKDTSLIAPVNLSDTVIKKMLQGIWAEREDENAWFRIKDDSIYYLEHQDEPVGYSIKNDTIIIDYEGVTIKNKVIKLTSDSLIFKTQVNTINKLYKR